MNAESSRRFQEQVETGIKDYLRQIAAALQQSHRAATEVEGVLADVEIHIRSELNSLGREPSMEDLNALLLRMDPPGAYAGVPASTAPEPKEAPQPRPTWMRPVWLLTIIVAALLLAYAAFDLAISRRSSPPRPQAESRTQAVGTEEGTPPGQPVTAPPVVAAPGAEDTERAAAVAVVTSKISVAVAGFSTSGNVSDGDAVQTVVNDGLINALAMTDGIRVVERARLDAALGELRMGAEGLLNPATALSVGRLLGAQVILTGQIVKLDDQVLITARMINAETGELAARQVRGSRGELLSLVDDLGSAIAERLRGDRGGALTGRAADTETATWRAKQREVKQAIAGKKLPRVLVMIPESHLGLPVRDPAAETELVLWLTDCGFRVTSPEYEGISPPHPVSESTQEGEIAFLRNRGWRNEEGRVNLSARSLHEWRTKGLSDEREKLAAIADVLILGEGISERASEREGLISCKGRVEIKLIDVPTGQVLLATSAYGAGVDVAERIAGKRALQAAGRTVAADIIPQLVEKWEPQATR